MNEHRSAAAEAVEIVVAQIRARSDQPRDGLPPLQLNDDRALRWSDRDATNVNIPAGISRRFDLLKSERASGNAELAFFDPPADRRHELPPGEYTVTVCATAGNTRPLFQTLHLSVPSGWSPGEPLDASRLVVDTHVAHGLQAALKVSGAPPRAITRRVRRARAELG